MWSLAVDNCPNLLISFFFLGSDLGYAKLLSVKITQRDATCLTLCRFDGLISSQKGPSSSSHNKNGAASFVFDFSISETSHGSQSGWSKIPEMYCVVRFWSGKQTCNYSHILHYISKFEERLQYFDMRCFNQTGLWHHNAAKSIMWMIDFTPQVLLFQWYGKETEVRPRGTLYQKVLFLGKNRNAGTVYSITKYIAILSLTIRQTAWTWKESVLPRQVLIFGIMLVHLRAYWSWLKCSDGSSDSTCSNDGINDRDTCSSSIAYSSDDSGSIYEMKHSCPSLRLSQLLYSR